MNDHTKTVLVFGATGQQGGSVAHALLSGDWHVKAFVRNPDSDNARKLLAAGAELVKGEFDDLPSIHHAVAGAYGVFSVQPSSGQGAAYGVTDDDEIRFGKTVADIACAAGVQHFIYSSTNAAGSTRTGMGHFDSKSEIENHIRTLGMNFTIIRPAGFMEILALPGLGLDQGYLSFLMRADQAMQSIAVEDIGKIVAQLFAEPDRYRSRTIEIAGDAATGDELAEKFGAALGRPIVYQRFPDSLLAENAFLGTLAALVDSGRLTGNVDLAAFRQEFPFLSTFDDWLKGRGRDALLAAAQVKAGGVALR